MKENWLIWCCIAFAAGCLLLCGCGGIEIYSPEGRLVAREFSVLKNVGFARFSTNDKGVIISKAASGVDDAAIEKITAGVVEGVVKGIR